MTVLETRAPGTAIARATPSVVLLTGVAVAAAIPVVRGKLLLLDVVCLAALPLLAVTIVYSRRLGLLALVTGAWVVGQVVADVTNGYAPRVSVPVLTAVTVFAIACTLVRLAAPHPARVRLLVAAVAAGLAVQQVLFTAGGTSLDQLWKYGGGLPVSVAALALCDLRWQAGSRAPMLLTLPALAAADLFAGARSLAAFTLLTLALYLIPPLRSRVRLRRVFLVGGVLAGVLLAAFFTAGRAGWLGARTADQVKRSTGDAYTLLVNARPEMLQAYYLTSSRPLTGYGSVPRIDSATYLASLHYLATRGVTVDESLRAGWLTAVDPGVASHSMLLDTTTRAGLLALPFWLVVLGAAVYRGVRAVALRASPLSAFWALVVLWDVLFSPLDGLYHVLLGAFLALALLPLPVPPPPTDPARPTDPTRLMNTVQR